jgi:tetratricopeptide (TPR) repeat protein
MIELKHSYFNALHVTRQISAVVFCISFGPCSFGASGTCGSGSSFNAQSECYSHLDRGLHTNDEVQPRPSTQSQPRAASEPGLKSDRLILAQLPSADIGKWHIRLDSKFPMGHSTPKKQTATGGTKVSAKADSESDPLKRAQAAIQVNDDSDAIGILNSAIKSSPKDRNLYEERGKCYLRNRQNYQALQDFTKALELGAPNAVLYRERANARFFLHNFDQCLQDLDGATKLSKPVADDYLLRANCQSSLGNPQLVVENCTAALKLAPKSAEAYYVRAKAYSVLKQQKQADSDYEKAVSLKK